MFTEPAELLTTWEYGSSRPGPGRAHALHRAARPEATADELLAAPLAVREADLYALRRTLFGDRMQVVTECGTCEEVVEFDLDASALAVEASPDDAVTGLTDGDTPGDGESLRVAADGWDVEFRLPTVADLAAAAAAGEASEARRLLVARCTLSARRYGRPVDARELPDTLVRRLAETAEHADPGVEVRLRVACPACGASTPAELDIAGYLWAELDCWARDLLLDVHLLATAYGWSEPEILALSPLRRRYYLELCADV